MSRASTQAKGHTVSLVPPDLLDIFLHQIFKIAISLFQVLLLQRTKCSVKRHYNSKERDYAGPHTHKVSSGTGLEVKCSQSRRTLNSNVTRCGRTIAKWRMPISTAITSYIQQNPQHCWKKKKTN